MTGSSPEKVQAIIDTSLQAMQGHVDKVKAKFDEVQARNEEIDQLLAPVVDWDDVPADATDETLAAILSRGEEFLMLYCKEGFAENFNSFLEKLSEDEPARLRSIVQIVRKDQMKMMMLEQLPLTPGSLTLQCFTGKPEDEHGEWTFVAVPVMIGEDFKASIPETLPVEMQISLYVRPEGTRNSLSETFNCEAHCMPAGAAVSPTVLTYQPDGDGLKALHINAYFRQGDEVQPIHQISRFQIGPEEAQPDDGFDLFGDDADLDDEGPFFGGPRP